MAGRLGAIAVVFVLVGLAALGLMASLAASTAQVSANAAIMQAQSLAMQAELLACLMIPVAGAAGFGAGYLVYAARQHFKRAKLRGIELNPARPPVSVSSPTSTQLPALQVPPQVRAIRESPLPPSRARRRVRVVTPEMLAYLTRIPGWGWDIPDEGRR